MNKKGDDDIRWEITWIKLSTLTRRRKMDIEVYGYERKEECKFRMIEYIAVMIYLMISD
jgi:hypothetical protein